MLADWAGAGSADCDLL